MAILSSSDIRYETAPPRPAGGFLLIELLVVIIILGSPRGWWPALFGPRGAEPSRPAAAQIELFGAALDQYRLGNRRLPPRGPGCSALVQEPERVETGTRPYLRSPRCRRIRGRAYQYKCCPGDHGDYDICRSGQTGAPAATGRRRRGLLGCQVTRGYSLIEAGRRAAVLASAVAVVGPRWAGRSTRCGSAERWRRSRRFFAPRASRRSRGSSPTRWCSTRSRARCGSGAPALGRNGVGQPRRIPRRGCASRPPLRGSPSGRTACRAAGASR